MEWAESQAYGPLGLKPWEFLRLTPWELNKLIDGYQVRREDMAYAASWFVGNLMNLQLKHPVKPQTLAKPFLRPKSMGEVLHEREEFLDEFTKEREEALGDGDDS